MKNISSNKKELKRKAILKAAAKVFSEKGYIETSIKNITDEALISVGSFYSFFSSKEEVLEQIYEEIANMSLQIASNVSMDPKDSVVKKFTLAMAGAVYTYVRNEELSKVLLVKSMGINELLEKKRWEILEKTNTYLKDILKHLKEEHLVDMADMADINITSVLLTHSIYGAIIYWISEKIEMDLNDMIFSLCTYHLNALKIDYTKDEVNKYISQIIISDSKESFK